MSGERFTVTVVPRGRGFSKMTLHRVACPTLPRAREVRDSYLSGWVADGRAVERGGAQWIDTPVAIGAGIAAERGMTQTYDEGMTGEIAYARLFAAKAARGDIQYHVCGRCKPNPRSES